MDCLLAVQDHTQPAEGGDAARFALCCELRVWMGDTGGGIGAAEVGVAAEGVCAGGLGSFARCLREHHCGEARVEDDVKVL